MLAPDLHLQIDNLRAVLPPTLYGMLCLFPYSLHCRHSLSLDLLCMESCKQAESCLDDAELHG